METIKYNLQLLDNGIVVEQLGYPLLECEKFDDDPIYRYEAVQKLLGKCLWEDVLHACNKFANKDLKVSITFEEGRHVQ